MAGRFQTSTPVLFTSLVWSASEQDATSEEFTNNASDLEDAYGYPTPVGTQVPMPGGYPPNGGAPIIPVIVFLVLTVATVVENLLVILAYCFNKSLQVYFNYFLLGMAIADLTVGLVDMPLSLVLAILGYWPFGNAACAIFAILDNVLIHISVLSVLVICVDRHYSVVSPLKHLRERGVRRALKLILPVYTISLLGWGCTVAVLWLVSSQEQRPFRGQCFLPLAHDLVYRVSFEIALYWAPLFLLIVLYSRVLLAMQQRKKNLELMRKREAPTASMPPKEPIEAAKKNRQEKMKPAKGVTIYNNLKAEDTKPTNASEQTPENPLAISEKTSGAPQPCEQKETPEGPSNQDGNVVPHPPLSEAVTGSIPGELAVDEGVQDSAPANATNPATADTGADNPGEAEAGTVRTVSEIVVADKETKPKKKKVRDKAKKKDASHASVSAAAKSNLKTIRTLSFIVLAVVVSWTPWAVLNVIENVLPGAVPPIIVQTGIFWVYLNSALNPLCYAAGNENYRRATLNLLRGKCDRN